MLRRDQVTTAYGVTNRGRRTVYTATTSRGVSSRVVFLVYTDLTQLRQLAAANKRYQGFVHKVFNGRYGVAGDVDRGMASSGYWRGSIARFHAGKYLEETLINLDPYSTNRL